MANYPNKTMDDGMDWKAERVTRDLLGNRSSLGELIKRYGPIAGAGLSNVLTGFHLGMIGRQDVLAFVRGHINALS